MPSLIPSKKSRNGNGAALAPRGDIPFFLSRMRDEFERLLERFSHVFERAGNGWRWDVDVRDQDDAVVVRAEAPGFEAGDFDVQVTGDRLVLRASKKSQTKDKEGKVREEREQQCFQSMTLPAGIDQDKVEAKYHSGVLTVTLPKTASAKGRKVAVKNA